jgi:cytidylate kinase
MALITMTSSIGCEAEEIGRLVAEKLKLEFYDDRRIEEEAGKLSISPEELKGFDEKTPGLLNRLFGQKPEIYLNLMQSLVYQLSSSGNAILLGHGAPWLLQDFGCALHARIYASNAARIQRLVELHGMSLQAAEKLIQKDDTQRSGFFQYAFRVDWNDSSLYDLMINRDKVDKDLAVKIIVEAAQSEGIKACNLTALDTMERLSLEKRVEAALLRAKISLRELNVEVIETGVVQLSGWLSPFVSKTGLEEIVRGVKGVSEVKLDISAVPRPHI